MTGGRPSLYRDRFAAQAANAGVSPSFEEMGAFMGISAKSGVFRLLKALEERGRIIRQPNRARCIEIVKDDILSSIPTAALVAELARRSAERKKAA